MKSLLLILLLFTSAHVPPHDFHTALAEVQHNPKYKTLEVSLRVFTDDLELAIATAGFEEPDFKMGRSEVPISVATYLRKNFLFISPKGENLPLKMIGHELDQDVAWVYFEVKLGAFEPENLDVDFRVLTEIFDDQSNILNYKGIDEKRTTLFRTGATRNTLIEG